jgi:uncharacterized protein YjiS (DUF1127 family)
MLFQVRKMMTLLPAMDHTTGRGVRRRRQSASTSRIGLLATIRLWIRRSQTRGALARLLERNDHLSNDHFLKDIGATQDEALREVGKWFWQR